jgi:hypothetical protein
MLAIITTKGNIAPVGLSVFRNVDVQSQKIGRVD